MLIVLESPKLLHIADNLLFTIHIVVILINLFGWILKSTRKLQLIMLISTSLSWFVLGLWYGMGYCFLTDWEWKIKADLKEKDLPHSFVHYLVNNSLGLNIDEGILDIMTIVLFVFAIILSFYVNFKWLVKTAQNQK